VYQEFVRRLSEIVFLAAVDYCQRQGDSDIQERAATLTTKAFAAFFPEMGAGKPEMVLRRFAATLRNVLDDEAFQSIKRVYYRHLFVYHMSNADRRRCMEAMLASGLAAKPADIAKRLVLPVGRVEELLTAGSRELRRIIEKDFDRDEVAEFTDGAVTALGESQ
jgi:hypothetical protein